MQIVVSDSNFFLDLLILCQQYLVWPFLRLVGWGSWLGELAGGVDWGILLAVHMGVLVLAFKVTFFHTC